MTKLLFCINTFSNGGIETALVNLANALNQSGDFKITIAFFGQTEHNFIYELFAPEIALIDMSQRFPSTMTKKPKHKLERWLWRARRQLSKALYTHAIPDFAGFDYIIDYRQGTSDFIAKKAFPHQKTISWMHGSFSIIEPPFQQTRLLKYDSLICLSENFMQIFRTEYPEHAHKIYKLHNLLNLQRIKTLSCDSSALTKEETALIEQDYFLHVSRISVDKDIETLIDGYQSFLKQTSSTIKLYLVGSGSQVEYYQNLIKERGLEDQILMLGEKNNPFVWMKYAQALFLSSNNEGLGNVLVEGLAAGTLVAVTDGEGGAPEVLGFGRYGPLFPPHSPSSIAQLMTKIATKELTAQSFDAGREEALSRFESKTIVNEFKAVLEHVKAS